MMAQMENTLRLSCDKDPPTLDPQKSCDKLSSAIIFLLFKGLTRFETNNTIRCDLADSFYALDNCKKYVFHLGKHSWSDGRPITAHDFVFSWKRALSPTFPAPAINFFYHIKNAEKAKKGRLSLDKVGVYANNEETLIVELEYPCPYFPELTSFCPFFPIPSQENKEKISSIYSGPFQLLYWIRGQEIFLRKNMLCKKPAQLEVIHIKIISDEKKAFALFEKGKLDWIGDPISPLPVAYLPAFSLSKKIKPIEGMVGCWFNTLKTPFHNADLRKAFAYAIPRKELLEKLLLPNALLTRGFFSSFFQGNDFPECQKTAKSSFQTALQECKSKFLKIKLSYEATDLFSRIAALLKTYWKDLFNIRVQLEPLSFKELFERLRQRKFEVTLIHAISQYTDKINFLERFESKYYPRNFSGWEHQKYQSILKKYRKTINHQERSDLAREAVSILLQEMPIAPVYCEHYAFLQKPRVKNLDISSIGIAHFDRVTLGFDMRNPSFKRPVK
jgi:oligopeptide transport system substrate-binding protein